MCKIRVSLTIFGRFLEGNLTLTTFGQPNFSLTIFGRQFQTGSSKYGQTHISPKKPSKCGQTQPFFAHFLADGTTSFLLSNLDYFRNLVISFLWSIFA